MEIVLFVHLKQEQEETKYIKVQLLEVVAGEDYPKFYVMVKSEKNCVTYMKHMGRKYLL